MGNQCIDALKYVCVKHYDTTYLFTYSFLHSSYALPYHSQSLSLLIIPLTHYHPYLLSPILIKYVRLFSTVHSPSYFSLVDDSCWFDYSLLLLLLLLHLLPSLPYTPSPTVRRKEWCPLHFFILFFLSSSYFLIQVLCSVSYTPNST